MTGPGQTHPQDWIAQGVPGLYSVVIPAHNEEGNLEATVSAVVAALTQAGIQHEILVVNDNSTDGTAAELEALEKRFPTLRHVDNAPPNGFGYAVRKGLMEFRGEAVAIVMADLSDQPADIVTYWKILQEGWDCSFGSRFIKGSKVVDYPPHKLVLNRFANLFIRTLFRHGLNDTTNAFKAYRREVISGMQPFLSPHFNLTVELPLKAIIRGYSYKVVPIAWHNRKVGVSKLKIREMGSRYLFIVLYCLIERLFSRGDFKRRDVP
ncbi:MAG: glycosyltransferase family 2 protein [Rhodospirillales bacterium]|nr:glycosyltransferase family 2 protein [Rhodospirillales bacterium]